MQGKTLVPLPASPILHYLPSFLSPASHYPQHKGCRPGSGRAGLSPSFVQQHANHAHSCLTRPISARTHLPPPAHRPGDCLPETFSAGVASNQGGKWGQRADGGSGASRNQKETSPHFWVSAVGSCSKAVTQTVVFATFAKRLKPSQALKNSRQGPPGSGRTTWGRWRETKAGTEVENSGDTDGSPASHTFANFLKDHMAPYWLCPPNLLTDLLVS